MQLVLMLVAAILVLAFFCSLPFLYFIYVRNRYLPLVCAKCHARVNLQTPGDKPACPGCGIELAADKDLTREYHKLPLIKIYAGYALIYGLLIYLSCFIFEKTYDVYYAATTLFAVVTSWSTFCGAMLIVAKTCSVKNKASLQSISGVAADLISSAASMILYGFILLMFAGLMMAVTDKCFPNPRALKLRSFPDQLILPLEEPGRVPAEKPLLAL